MNDTQNRDRVDEFVQFRPALSANPAHHTIRRGNCQGNQHNECQGAKQNVVAFDDVFDHALKIEKIVDYQPGQKMKQDVEKREYTQHPPQHDQLIDTRDKAKRSNCEGDDQNSQSPNSGYSSQVFNRVGADVPSCNIEDYCCCRNQTQNKDKRLGPPDPLSPLTGTHCHHNFLFTHKKIENSGLTEFTINFIAVRLFE